MPLGRRTDFGEAKYSGVEAPFHPNALEPLEEATGAGFDFVVIPLINPACNRSYANGNPPSLPASPSDITLISSQWCGQVVGRFSEWLDPDGSDAALSAQSAAALRQELEWAAHLSLQACIYALPPHWSNANSCHLLTQFMGGLSNMAVWLRLPLLLDSTPDQPGSWEQWDRARCLCGHNIRLGVVLEVGRVLPAHGHVARWLGEPVRALIVPAALFVANKCGYPTLPRAHQELLVLFWRHGVQVILSGNPTELVPALPLPAAATNGVARAVTTVSGPATSVVAAAGGSPWRLFCEYLSFLFRRPKAPPQQDLVELGYRDYLQAPLQPLQDNLESQTYETFERDDTKYSTYEAAIHAALLRRVATAEAGPSGTTRVAVVGAGRGPLVRAALAAAGRAGVDVSVTALEKNTNAVVHLHDLVAREGWSDTVTVVQGDMRAWEAGEGVDVLVSELLGSFGDNELSPECLDGACRALRPGGVCIPRAYTSFLQPITAAKLWNDVKAYNDLEHCETPYVVKLHRVAPLAPTLRVFSFEHRPGPPSRDNARFSQLHFRREGEPAALCHGFAGYFEAELFEDVQLSIHPPTHTPDMFSWFPIFFPLRDPVHLAPGQALDVAMWRCGANHKVWYEWAVLAPMPSHIHNTGGRSYHVGL